MRTVKSAENGSSGASSSAGDAARNAATNGLANSGKGGASAGAAVSTAQENSTAQEKMAPLSAFAHVEPIRTPLNLNHQGLFVASMISFNLAKGALLSEAIAEIDKTAAQLGMPPTIHGASQGNAKAFQQSDGAQGFLFLAAIAAVYIVLGILYEASFIRSRSCRRCRRQASARCGR